MRNTDEDERYSFGQILYYQKTRDSRGSRSLMAQVALNIGGLSNQYPVDLSAAFTLLTWSESQAVLALLSMKVNTQVEWPSPELKRLKKWAACI